MDDRIEKAKNELCVALFAYHPTPGILCNNEITKLIDVIEEYVDAKVDGKVKDLRDEINKTGIWDPDW